MPYSFLNSTKAFILNAVSLDLASDAKVSIISSFLSSKEGFSFSSVFKIIWYPYLVLTGVVVYLPFLRAKAAFSNSS